MPLPRTNQILLGAAIAVLAACSSVTGVADATDVVDPTLDFDSAQMRWVAVRPSNYGFDFITHTAMVPSAGFHHVEVLDGRVATVWSYSTGGGTFASASYGLTIDSLWARFNRAKSQGETLTSLRFSTEGVPLEAMVGSFANDGGVHYEVRNFMRFTRP